MGQIPAKQFPAPAAFGNSQMNTLQKAQAPDLIQQQQLPSLTGATQAAGLGNSVAPKAANPAAPINSNLFLNPMFRRFYGQSQ